MNIVETNLQDVVLLEPVVHSDARGFFMESFKADWLAKIRQKEAFIQDNHSLSRETGVLRGLHYQLEPKAQAKLVRVLRGAIYDVVLDLRQSSRTFGQWQGFNLNASNKRQLFVPRGFAHGFCTLVPDTEVLYKVDAAYAPAYERGIIWNDPELDIAWPVERPQLSDKDAQLPRFQDAELFQ